MDLNEFGVFLDGHRQRHPSARLLPFDKAGVLYGAWHRILKKRGIDDVRALEAASMRMIEKPPPRGGDHFVTLCSYAEDAMKALGGAAPRDTSTREGAEAASKGCDRGCGGTGMAAIYHPRPDPANRIPATTSAYCVCALGRWIERNHAAKHPEVRKRMFDLDDVLTGRSIWLAEPPNMADVDEEMVARFFPKYRETLADSMTQKYREGGGR